MSLLRMGYAALQSLHIAARDGKLVDFMLFWAYTNRV